jgi:hypothetical protein
MRRVSPSAEDSIVNVSPIDSGSTPCACIVLEGAAWSPLAGRAHPVAQTAEAARSRIVEPRRTTKRVFITKSPPAV